MTSKKDYLIKRIKGKLRTSKPSGKFPFSKWVTSTKHIMYDSRGLWILNTKQSKRYNNAKNKTIKELEEILSKL